MNIVIIISMAIVVVLAILNVKLEGRIEGFHDSAECLDLDGLAFTERNPTLKNRPVREFELPLPLESIPAPPRNSSKATKKELKYLVGLTKQKKALEQRKLCLEIEREGALNHFINYAGSNGLVYDNDHLTKVAQDVETLAHLMKSHYNRPRPYQLSFLVAGSDIEPVAVAQSSSYPCEHAMISKVIADQLTHNNPEHKEAIHGVAKKIELSRYYGGMNFPSDTVVALQVADILKDKVDYLDTDPS
jgi:hypothetical protein